ncbi:MAG: hypothetical protein K0S74_1088 [Chlamydiales bacterium]|jgi:putative component of membrane protein insertase Oxa1/YidC/SpoIIIJ protein YidD|nr:hypothetical protein [Chlamydiales bacterium]
MKIKSSLFILYYLILLCNSSFLTAEEPWGQDGSLAAKYSELPIIKQKAATRKVIRAQRSTLGKVFQLLIRFHQRVLSPVDGPRSHFYPCSSQYMYQAINKYGALEGFTRGCDRLLRENDDPWMYRTIAIRGEKIKYDPVP